ncbi:MAG TPA: hypothetical protein IAB06_07615 [Candidatus Avacidaminococcus intestinavium]|uniref:Uncharacterized protein n=1 Tax=Candidatus Avacidaminococcus intestinavium TaxID=2840684 RepID=A0A9D1SMC3_9FIRM|nr:hypothetical protein [Candidatus Avacidaminococcus intestinavium]
MNKKVFEDSSIVTKKNVIVMIVAILLFTGFLIINILRYLELGVREPVVIFLDIMFLYVIFSRCYPKYTNILDKRGIRFIRKSLFLSGEHEVPYREIIGVHKYKAALVHAAKFRRSFTFNSALDGRTVWVLAYRTTNKKGKPENRRVFFKASEDFLNTFAEKMPNKIRITEEEVAVEIFRREEESKSRR